MVLAILVFLLVAGAVAGGYVAVAHLPQILEGRRLEKRLREVSLTAVDAPSGDATVVMAHAEGPVPIFDRALAATRAGDSLTRLIEQSGVKTTASMVLVMSIAAAALAALCLTITVRQPWAPLVGGLIGLGAPFAWLLRRRSTRLAKFEEQFPEGLDLISRAIRAGHAFQTALGMVADELPAPVGQEFRTTFERQNFGLPIREAMNEMADRVPILDVRFFVTAVAIQRETGGNLAEILDNLAHVVRERFKIRRQVRVHTAHGRFTGYVLLALPAALAVALSFIAPEQMTLLFRDPMGRMMLGGAIVLQIIGFIWVRQVIKIEV